jgi:amidophosphoribosyltransferase
MCGIVGAVNKKGERSQIGSVTYVLLNGVQHRGYESAGMSRLGDNGIETIKGLGPVNAALPTEKIINKTGFAALGQVRYSNTGSGVTRSEKLKFQLGKTISDKWKRNAQPFYRDSLKFGDAALVQNGNLTNAQELKKWLQDDLGLVFKGETDTEVILVLLMYYVEFENLSVLEAIQKAMTKMRGSFSCLLLTKEGIIAFRDKKGFHPLEIGEDDNFFYFASEPCAWHLHRAKHIGEVKPGEIIEAKVGQTQLIRHPAPTKCKLSLCIFEYIYLMAIYNPQVKKIRDRYGRALFQHHQLPGLIISMMESGQGAALGYSFAQAIKLPGQGCYDNTLPKDPSLGRSFLEAEQLDREEIVRIKYHFLLPQISDKIDYFASNLNQPWINIVDDSLVRGTTSRIIIQLVRELLQEFYPQLADKIKIAWLASSPPYKYPCYMGIDTYDQEKLIAWRVEQELKGQFPGQTISQDQIIEVVRQQIGADYLGYLPIEDARQITAEALGLQPTEFCDACFTENYPIPVNRRQHKMSCA